MAATYKVLSGLTYAGKRVEAGAIVSDIPTKSIPWLKAQGLIEDATPSKTEKREHVSDDEGDE